MRSLREWWRRCWMVYGSYPMEDLMNSYPPESLIDQDTTLDRERILLKWIMRGLIPRGHEKMKEVRRK